MPRFVVQHHRTNDGDEHWDLMLEVGEKLRTWSLPYPPDDPAASPMHAQQLRDHRLEYLEYEGEISGDRGAVRIHDRGDYEWTVGGELETWLVDVVEVRLTGQKVSGRYRLERSPQEGRDIWRWRRVT